MGLTIKKNHSFAYLSLKKYKIGAFEWVSRYCAPYKCSVIIIIIILTSFAKKSVTKSYSCIIKHTFLMNCKTHDFYLHGILMRHRHANSLHLLKVSVAPPLIWLFLFLQSSIIFWCEIPDLLQEPFKPQTMLKLTILYAKWYLYEYLQEASNTDKRESVSYQVTITDPENWIYSFC